MKQKNYARKCVHDIIADLLGEEESRAGEGRREERRGGCEWVSGDHVSGRQEPRPKAAVPLFFFVVFY